VHVDAKVDTGAQFCLFSREIGERLGLDVEGGLRREMGTLAGRMTAYGHEVTLETLGLVLSTFVFFSEEGRLPRNLLGRVGWLRLIRLAVVDYEHEIYLSPYDDPQA
jgi:predicted aspartyl protease